MHPSSNVAQAIPSLSRLKFLGAEAEQKCIDGVIRKRLYLDTAATALPLANVQDSIGDFLNHYGSSHSGGHHSGLLAIELEDWSKSQILSHLNAPADEYDVVFAGFGATAAINRIAAGLNSSGKGKALISLMEHHSNDLPHREHAREHIHIDVSKDTGWVVDIDQLDSMLALSDREVGYVTLTAASNVTGLTNQLREAARVSHKHGAILLVDGAQAYSHCPVSLKGNGDDDVDIFVFSGHKAHAVASPGVIVAKKALLAQMPPFLTGGGMVGDVSRYSYNYSNSIVERESAGTSNTSGIYGIGLATESLRKVGIVALHEHELSLRRYALHQLSTISGIRLYGDSQSESALGVIAFNIDGIPHALVGQMLNDYFAIAVRTGCFCAHPYVRELLLEEFWGLDVCETDVEKYKGMVRASFGPHNTYEDIDFLVKSIKQLLDNYRVASTPYKYDPSRQSYRHRDALRATRALFDNLIRD